MNEITKHTMAEATITPADPTVPHEPVAIPEGSKKAPRKARRRTERVANGSNLEAITPPASPDESATITDNQPLGLVPVLAEEVQPVATRAFWAGRINSRLTTGVRWIVEAGKDLLEAKERLPHGEFEIMFETGQVKISIRSAQMLMRIASNQVLSKANNYASLPHTLNALYVLSVVKETKLQRTIDKGQVSPSMKISDARALVPKSSASNKEGKTHDPVMGAPTCTERDPEAAFERAAKILDTELDECPDDKSRLRLCQRLVSRLLIKMTSINNQKAADAHSTPGQ